MNNTTDTNSTAALAGNSATPAYVLARALQPGQLVSLHHPREIIETVTRRDAHVYVTTDYTRTTGGMAYDFDIMDKVALLNPEARS